MRRQYDEHPFWEKGVAGAFALGAVTQAVADGVGDGQRAAWALVAPLGVELRPAPPIRAYEPPRVPHEEQARLRAQWREAATAVAVEVMRVFPACLTALGMVRERGLWEAKVAACPWQPYLKRCADAWSGNTYCEGRLDVVFSDRARASGLEAWWPVSRAVGQLLSDHWGSYRTVDPWWQARRAGEAAVAMAGVLGERGWAEVERIARMTRGEVDDVRRVA